MSINLSTRVHPVSVGYGYKTVAAGGKMLTPSLRPSHYAGERGKWDADLVITRPGPRGYSFNYRFQVGYVDPTGSCRRVHGGPVVPGPYAFAYGLASVIAADPRMGTAFEAAGQRDRGIEHPVDEGDLIRLGSEIFRVRYDRDQWINLDHVASAI